MFALRLNEELANAIRRRAEEHRRTVRATAEMIVEAGLAALEQKERKGRKAP